MLAQTYVQQVPVHPRRSRWPVTSSVVYPAGTKLWPAQYQHHSCRQCRTQSSGGPDLSRSADGISDVQPQPTSPPVQPTPVQQPMQQQQTQPPATQSPQPQQAAGADSAQQMPLQQPQPQQAARVQQQPQQQQTKQTALPSTSSTKSKARKQKQRPFFLFSWFQAAAAALKNMPSTLVTFVLGGLGAAFLLYSWARGSPLHRHRPYCFTLLFNEASKVDVGTPVRMKGVQIGNVATVTLHPSHVEAVAEIADAANIIPQGSRVDINLLGLAADPWIDITPPANAVVRKDHGPHHPACASEGLIVCHNGSIRGQLGGSTDFMMKFFLSQHDRTRVKVVEDIYHGKHV